MKNNNMYKTKKKTIDENKSILFEIQETTM